MADDYQGLLSRIVALEKGRQRDMARINTLMTQAEKERQLILARLPTPEQVSALTAIANEREAREVKRDQWRLKETAMLKWGGALIVILQIVSVSIQIWIRVIH